MTIRFTHHVAEKIIELENLGIFVTKAQLEEVLRNPELIDYRRLPLLIAQSSISNRLVIRVVYRILDDGVILGITIYPGNKKRYENY